MPTSVQTILASNLPLGYTGSVGYTGSTGFTGSQGIQGIIGYTGSDGIDGLRGYSGSIGFTGSQGIQGIIGYTGSDGINGLIGFTGSRGSVGFTGSIGSLGYTGSVGYTGSKGTTYIGDTPPVSPTNGDTWYNSSDGIRYIYYNDGTSSQWVQESTLGPSGPIGYTGSVSTIIGFTGSIGYTGSQGYTGSASTVIGYTGSQGVIGYTGSTVYPSAGIAVSTGTAWETSKTTPTGDVVGTTDTQTLSNKTFQDATFDFDIKEKITVSATAATGTINLNVLSGQIVYYTTNASANFTINIRGNVSTSLDSLLQTGEVITITFLNTNGVTAYYNNVVQVDGNSITPRWQGGTVPSTGNASSIDGYTYTIIKTGAATFTVLASQTQFKS